MKLASNILIMILLFSCSGKRDYGDSVEEKVNLKPYYFPLETEDTIIRKSHLTIENNEHFSNEILYHYVQRINKNKFCFVTYHEDFVMHDSLIMVYDSLGVIVKEWFLNNLETNTLIKAKILKNKLFTYNRSRLDKDTIEMEYQSILYGDYTSINYLSIAKLEGFDKTIIEFSTETECVILKVERIINYTNLKTYEKAIQKFDESIYDLKGFGYLKAMGKDNFGSNIIDNVTESISTKQWEELKRNTNNENL